MWSATVPGSWMMAEADLGDRLVALARAAIRHGLSTGAPPPSHSDSNDGAIAEPAACFVTLTKAGVLRGCVGSLRPERPLGDQVALSAFQAAFRDPRVPPVTADEVDVIDIAVSVLSPLEPVDAATDDELAAVLQPGVDGLLAEHSSARATFLPKVWRDLPDPQRFLAHLKHKAGLAGPGWPPGTRFFRYTTTDYDSTSELV